MDSFSELVKIQTQLEEYRNLVNAVSHIGLMNYRPIIIEGGFVCESMLSFIIQERGFSIENGFVIDDTASPPRKTLLSFCIEKNDLLPVECREFVALIRSYRNNAVHGDNATFETVQRFLKHWIALRFGFVTTTL